MAEPELKKRRVDFAEGTVVAEERTEDLKLRQLRALDEKLGDVQEEQALAVLQVEKSFLEKKKPILEERDNLLEKWPGFWRKAVENHDVLGRWLSDFDHKMLDAVSRISIEETPREDSGQDITLTFEFKDNPVVSSSVVQKKFYWTVDPDEILPEQGTVDFHGEVDEETKRNSFICWLIASENERVCEFLPFFQEELLEIPAEFYAGAKVPRGEDTKSLRPSKTFAGAEILKASTE